MPTFIDPLNRALQVGADRTAVLYDGDRTSYRELWTRCRKLAGMVAAKGAEPGDRIAILAANSPQYLEMYVGLPAAGFVIVPLNTRHAEPELHYALEDSGARVLITDRDPGALADLVEHVPSHVDDRECQRLGDRKPAQVEQLAVADQLTPRVAGSHQEEAGVEADGAARRRDGSPHIIDSVERGV